MKKKELLVITVRLLTEENERLRTDVAYWKEKANKEFNDKLEVVDEALEGYGGGVVKSNPNITHLHFLTISLMLNSDRLNS